jgi:hypothetical protein
MSKEAMKLALEALENSIDLVSHEARNAEELYRKYPSRLARIQGLVAFEVAHEKAITTLREALAEQPAQRTWVGLTEEKIFWEYQKIWPFHPAEEPTLAKAIVKFARAIEAKLKEKNT